MKSILLALAIYSDPKGVAWPSQAMLASDAGLSLRAARDALSKLEYFGLIKRMKRGNGHGGRSSDLIAISIDREFSVGKSDVKKAAQLAVENAGKSKWGYRQLTTELPAAAAGEITRELPDISLPVRGTTVREKVIPVSSDTQTREGTGQVIPFVGRGAA